MTDMLSVQKTAPEAGLELRRLPQPAQPAKGEVVVEVAAVGICGSDLHIDSWTAGYAFLTPLMPITLGHEMSGVVRHVGPDVTTLAVGDRVVVAPGLNCGTCASCRVCDWDACENMAVPGILSDGGMAQFVRAPHTSVFPIPDALDLDIAALCEPLCVALRAVRVAEIQHGDRVAVQGPGTIGQALAFFAKLHGAAEVYVAGFNDAARLDVVQKLGFPATFDLARADEEAAFMQAGKGVDVVFEATGNPISITQGIEILRNDGRLIAAGIHGAPAIIDLVKFVRKRLQLRASHKFHREDWPYVIATLAAHAETVRPMITHRLPLAQALEGFALAKSGAASKVILKPNQATAT